MKKVKLPVDPELRTKAQRVKRAKLWAAETVGWSGLIKRACVSVVIGSKRKNVKGITCATVAEVHYETHSTEASYAVATLKDRRVVFIAAAESAPATTIDISHDLEHLWWYGLTQKAREAFARADA
jgi:hypothetical protein